MHNAIDNSVVYDALAVRPISPMSLKVLVTR
jgi:hypothetical protein